VPVSSPRVRRTAAAALVLPVGIALLAGCTLPFGGPSGVRYDGKDSTAVQSATIQFQGQGTFISMDTIDPAEYGWSGSGFFISSDGVAVTNNHVVTGAGTLSVAIGGDSSRTYPARVLSTSECLDIAVVKVDVPEAVPFFEWSEGPISTGSDVYALGFPIGDPVFSMTRGVIVKSDYAFDTYDNVVQHGIQSDATIRGGNSGGPLINAEGRVVGVNFYGSDQIATSNYAIGRDDVLPVLDRLIAGESVLSLGLNLLALNTDDPYGLQGIWVQSVAEGGAADLAGIEPGDVLEKLGGVTLAGPSSLSQFEGTTEGTMKNYCDVLQTKGVDAPISVQVYRPATDELLEGEVNGAGPIEVTATNVYGGTTEVSSYQDVVSDDGRIYVSAPSEWNQIDTISDASGTQLQVTTDLQGFAALAAEGVELSVYGYQANGTPEAVIAALDSGLGEGSGCTAASGQIDQPYADGYYTGYSSVWVGCSTGADVGVLAVDADDSSSSGYVIIVGTFGEDAANDPTVVRILSTFLFS